MSKTPTPFFLFLLFAMLSPIAGTTKVAETTNGDSSFKGNRRPGILGAPTEEPTGENALLFRRMGKLRPNELLELVSE